MVAGLILTFQVTASDADGGSFGSVSYSLGSGPNGAPPSQFSVNKETGEICTSLALDREHGRSSYDFTVTAVDGGGSSSVAHVKIDLVDINDNRPSFYPLSYAVSLSTQSAPGTSVVRVTAFDPDTGDNGRVTYRTAAGGASPYFTLNKDTGVISLSRSLHGKANSVITMAISAADGGGLVAPADAQVNISVVAGAVAPPVFQQSQYHFTVSEDGMRGSLVGTVQAGVKTGSPKDILYTISSGDPTGYFSVDPDTGVLRTSLPLDHEAQPTLDLEVQARSGSPPAYGQTRVRVSVSDVNDNSPLFLPSSSEMVLLPEQTEAGSVVYRVQAHDADSGANGQLTFDLDPSGEVRLAGSLSYESSPRFDLRVTARDGGVPQRSSALTLVVHVQAENTQGPVFDTVSYRVELREGVALNTRFLQVRARDREAGPSPGSPSAPVYHLRPDGDAAGFGVAADSGWLFVRSSLDREAKDMYLLTVLASAGRGQLKRTGSATVRVSVTDENDNSPRLTQERVFLAVKENLPPGTGFGHVAATDRDSGHNARLTYRFLHADRHFQINPQTGEISTREALDREHQSSHQLLLLVQDGGSPPRSSTGTAFISVQDDNDNAPTFSHQAPGRGLSMQILEGQAPGLLIGTVHAKDPDEGENGSVTYALSGARAERFTLDPSSGDLRSSSPLSHSERGEYSLVVMATDRGLPPRSSSCSLRIQVLSLTRPSSTTSSNSISLTFNSVEEATPGSVLGSVRLPGGDPDARDPRRLTYTVVGGSNPDGTFAVDRHTGDVYLVRPLDYEQEAHHTLQIQVDDPEPGPSAGARTLVRLDVDVADSNDHSPEFPEDPVTVVVSESTAAGSSLFTFQAWDGDGAGPNSELRYAIARQWPEAPGLLSLDPATGVLSLGRRLDRENDNPPEFASPAAVSVMEDQPVGFVVLYVVARDADQGENGRVSYSIQSGNAGGAFSLNPNTGSLSIFKPLDREDEDTFNLTVVAQDHGTPQRTSSQLLCVHVIDVNDEAPRFPEVQYDAEVPENQAAGLSVLLVSAVDLDQGTNGHVTYGRISGEGFSVDPATGVITTAQVLDREIQEFYTLTVYAKDGGLPPNVAKATVKIRVTDENDNAPVFGRLFYSIEVPENAESSYLFTLRATDQDTGERGEISYKITAGDPSADFRLDGRSGVLSTSRPLDRERKAGYSLTVVAQDRGQPALSGSATVEVRVLDVNDHTPRFQSASYTTDVSEDVQVGSFVLEVKASDLDQGANSQVVYRLTGGSRGMFIIDQNTGRIITAAPLDREKTASYDFDVHATDSSPSNPLNASAHVTVYIQDVNDHAPFFIQDPLVLNVSVAAVTSHRVLATMRAEDKDFGANGSVFYRFAGTVRGFSINSLTGDIQATERLQGLTQGQRTLVVEARDQGSPSRSSLGVVVVYVREQSYQGIRFPRNGRDVSLQENAAKGTAIIQTQAQYPDGSRLGITYSLFSGNKMQSFGINPTSGEIWVQNSEVLDFEETPRLRLVVKAETASSSSYMAVNLLLQDVNDNLPRFQLQNYVAYIREAQGHDFPIIQVIASDPDQGQNGQLSYSLRTSSVSGLFKIDPVTGSISTAAIMDREIWTHTKLVVMATDRGSPRLAGSATLTVVIVDLNDNSPTVPLPGEVRVPEDTLVGTVITLVTGNDVDSGPALSYTLTLAADCRDTFGIQRYGGDLLLTAPLDYEERSWYTLTVRASDSRHQSEANLTVLVEDVNDNAPMFTQDLYQVSVSEHLPAGSTVITVTATDRDSADNGMVTYRVMSSTRDIFYIDPKNGTLFISRKAEFDVENPSILVVIEARDQGTPSLSSFATVQVQVSDVNDNAPIFHQSEYRASVSEDGLPGSTILTLEAVDADLSRDNCGFDFAIASGNTGNAFQIESSVRFLEGRGFQTVGNLILAEGLDFEAVASYNLSVVVSDRGVPQRSSSVPVLIGVLDANDNPPTLSRTEYSVVLSEGTAAGTEILHLSATDPDSAPNGEVQYSVSSGDETGLFQVDRWTGALRLQKTLDRERRSVHVVVVQASDSQGHYALAPVTVEVKDVNDNRPYFPLKLLSASVRENQPQNAFVAVLHAIDQDRGVFGQLRYHMLDDSKEQAFVVNQTSGEVRTRTTFDYEKVNSFQFVAVAMDAGNYSATVTVEVYVTGEDEYDPAFTSSEFSFRVPEGARKGQSVGQVQARDEDEGMDGVVLYSLADSSQPYFEVNKTTGVISLKMDSYGRHSGRSKREVRVINLDVVAHGPLETSRAATAHVTVDVTHTSFGLPSNMNMLLISVIAVSLGTIVILIIIAVALFFVKLRRRKKEHHPYCRPPPTATALHKLEESKLAGNEMIYHQALPGYGPDQGGNGGGPYTRGGSLDPSHSSGRGSAEAEAADDDEIRMINEYPRVSSISSSMQERISARGPDSGIQQDADQLSDVSGEPSVDPGQWFKAKKLGGTSGTLPASQIPIYRDEGGGYLGVGRGMNISHPRDYAFPQDGKPLVDGSLTAIVASDEELRGSYNWDYLLNWCPQFQPLASVFTEIARLKDETEPPNPRRPLHHKAKAEPRIDPPPLITSVAHPGAKTVPPKPAVGRSFPHLASLRRSPLSSDGSISSAAMSPSFSPSLSPLAARSPAVTPFSVSQGPSASMISATEHHLEHSEEAEIRI
ncbi:hypothetical protein NHX12_008336 [Muraenolepis orangiensis]|uniref:Cadherin domain-containing protein n=1 Tax=Muraenolepis orangiensis TaxID=630683 RepID=A0A9Q0DKK0_9TELE|nr:hypothetical protein NHX12_008336 [Muraenolepis orangiensis]